MNIPNILTTMRFCLIPVFVYFYLIKNNQPVSVTVFALSALTDFLDGFIARRFDMKTDWGSAFDPIADKVTQLTTVFCIAMSGVTIMWIAFFLMLFKEAVVIAGGLRLYRKKDIVVTSNWIGKCSTALFYLIVVVIICFRDVLSDGVINVMVAATLAASFLAGAVYAYSYFIAPAKNARNRAKDNAS